MKNIKKYDEFVNEEINLRKALTGVALGTGLAFSNPIVGQTSNNINNIEVGNQLSIDIDGWGKAKWGMSPDQVKVVFPESVKDSTVYDTNLNLVSLLKINDFLIGDYKYEVNFVFKDNKLEYVRLELNEDHAFEVVYNQIKPKLVEKYGHETYNKPKDKYGLESKWITNSGTVSLKLYIGASGTDFRKIWIEYKKKESFGF